MKYIVGVDEAGRGAWFGNVVAAAVALPKEHGILGLNDSKQLSAKQREKLFDLIIEKAIAAVYAQVSSAEIDQINIHQATLKAMQMAIMGISCPIEKVLIDGKFIPVTPHKCEAVIKGDSLFDEIKAASIIAKVIRDRQMDAFDYQFPHYYFAKHKGYGTALHLQSIEKYGILPLHRKSYSPIKKRLH